MSRILLTLTAMLTAIVVAAGCGSDDSSSSDAASLAPAGSLMYGEATLEPEGDQKAAIDALIEKFPGEGNAADRIRRLMEQAFADSDSGLSYAKDVEPWLGGEAAFFLSNLGAEGDSGNGALLLATDDEDKARDAIDKALDGRNATYEDTDYVIEDGGAAGVVDGWVVLGTERGFKAAVDTAGGGDAIDGNEAYEQALADASEDRLGFIYTDLPAVYEQAKKSAGSSAMALPPQFDQFFSEPVLATMNATDAGVRFDGTLPESLTAGFPLVGEGSDLAAGLPADSWLAMAQPDLGKTVDQYIELFAGAVGGRDQLAQQFKTLTGLDLEQDVVSWMGDWGLFVRGTSLSELNGALVIETSDEAASGRVIETVARLARRSADSGERVRPLQLSGGGEGVTLTTPDVPQPVHLFQRDGKVVLAYGDAAAADAVEPSETLGDSAGFADAEQALGGDFDVSFYLAMDPVLELVDSTEAGSDTDWQEAKPYLEPLAALVAGARKEGDKLDAAFALTVD
jgi:hypothetical protein